MGFQSASAQTAPAPLPPSPAFNAYATITPDTTTYHCVPTSPPNQGAAATHIVASSGHYIQVTGEPANVPVNIQYDLSLGMTPNAGYGGTLTLEADGNDGLNGIVNCDNNGVYKHKPFGGTDSTMSFSVTQRYAIGGSPSTWVETDHAIAQIINLTTPSQKSYVDSKGSVTFAYP